MTKAKGITIGGETGNASIMCVSIAERYPEYFYNGLIQVIDNMPVLLYAWQLLVLVQAYSWVDRPFVVHASPDTFSIWHVFPFSLVSCTCSVNVTYSGTTWFL